AFSLSSLSGSPVRTTCPTSPLPGHLLDHLPSLVYPATCPACLTISWQRFRGDCLLHH
ncbi:hypothetical protein Dimus_004784, partial [Dionaea muscipula]